jgi:hypothetical protein
VKKEEELPEEDPDARGGGQLHEERRRWGGGGGGKVCCIHLGGPTVTPQLAEQARTSSGIHHVALGLLTAAPPHLQ